MRLRLTWIFVLTLTVFVAGCGQRVATQKSNSQSANDKKTISNPPAEPPAWGETEQKPELDANAPVLKFTVSELYDRLANSDSGEDARKQFTEDSKGHWIELSGFVLGYQYSKHFNSITLHVIAPSDPEADKYENLRRPQLVCVMQSPAEAWEKANVGDEITIRAIWTNFNGLHDGRIISGGTPPPKISATELTEELAKDRKAATEKFAGKYWLVTGAIAPEQSTLKEKPLSIGYDRIEGLLSGSDGSLIAFDLPRVPVVRHPMEPGQEVPILGKIQFPEADKIDEEHPFSVEIVDGSRLDDD